MTVNILHLSFATSTYIDLNVVASQRMEGGGINICPLIMDQLFGKTLVDLNVISVLQFLLPSLIPSSCSTSAFRIYTTFTSTGLWGRELHKPASHRGKKQTTSFLLSSGEWTTLYLDVVGLDTSDRRNINISVNCPVKLCETFVRFIEFTFPSHERE